MAVIKFINLVKTLRTDSTTQSLCLYITQGTLLKCTSWSHRSGVESEGIWRFLNISPITLKLFHNCASFVKFDTCHFKLFNIVVSYLYAMSKSQTY